MFTNTRNRRFPISGCSTRIAGARKEDPEFELLDTGIFDGGRYFDITIEYAKASPNDILIRLRVDNRGPEASTLHLLPTVWFRNAWSWGRTGEGYWPKPSIRQTDATHLACEQMSLGKFKFEAIAEPDLFLFTENETNMEMLYRAPNESPYVKDAFHRYLVHGDRQGSESEGDRHQSRRILPDPNRSRGRN